MERKEKNSCVTKSSNICQAINNLNTHDVNEQQLRILSCLRKNWSSLVSLQSPKSMWQIALFYCDEMITLSFNLILSPNYSVCLLFECDALDIIITRNDHCYMTYFRCMELFTCKFDWVFVHFIRSYSSAITSFVCLQIAHCANFHSDFIAIRLIFLFFIQHIILIRRHEIKQLREKKA